MTTTTSGTSDTPSATGMDRLTSTAQQAAGTAQRAADTVAGVAGEMTARLPDAASSTKDAIAEANRVAREGSDETLKVVGALSLGFAAGLLIGGANRLLVIAALVPTAFVGAALIERLNAAAGGSRTAPPVQRG